MLSAQFDTIAETLNEEGIEFDVYDNYSGNGMNGRTCQAFLVDDPMIIAWACGRAGICIVEDVNLRVDSLGRGKVVY